MDFRYDYGYQSTAAPGASRQFLVPSACARVGARTHGAEGDFRGNFSAYRYSDGEMNKYLETRANGTVFTWSEHPYNITQYADGRICVFQTLNGIAPPGVTREPKNIAEERLYARNVEERMIPAGVCAQDVEHAKDSFGPLDQFTIMTTGVTTVHGVMYKELNGVKQIDPNEVIIWRAPVSEEYIPGNDGNWNKPFQKDQSNWNDVITRTDGYYHEVVQPVMEEFDWTLKKHVRDCMLDLDAYARLASSKKTDSGVSLPPSTKCLIGMLSQENSMAYQVIVATVNAVHDSIVDNNIRKGTDERLLAFKHATNRGYLTFTENLRNGNYNAIYEKQKNSDPSDPAVDAFHAIVIFSAFEILTGESKNGSIDESGQTYHISEKFKDPDYIADVIANNIASQGAFMQILRRGNMRSQSQIQPGLRAHVLISQ